MFQTLLLLADAQGAAAPEGATRQQSMGMLDLVVMLLPMALLFYFLILRPESRKYKDQRSMLSSLKKRDKVLTTAGIYGTIVNVSETENEITVKVDDNTRIKMVKEAISRNLSNEEAARATGAPGKTGTGI